MKLTYEKVKPLLSPKERKEYARLSQKGMSLQTYLIHLVDKDSSKTPI